MRRAGRPAPRPALVGAGLFAAALIPSATSFAQPVTPSGIAAADNEQVRIAEEVPPTAPPAPAPTVSPPAVRDDAPGTLRLLAALAVIIAVAGAVVAGLTRRRLAAIEQRLRGIEAREAREPHEVAAVGGSSEPTGDAPPPATARSAPEVESLPADTSRPPPFPAAPMPEAPRLGGADQVEALRVELATLVASPALRRADYDAALRGHGRICAVDVAPGEAPSLSEWDDDPKRRIVAVVFADDTLAIVPSSRYVKDFAMTYKETVDAGQDVRTVFKCVVDGTAVLKLVQVPTGKADASGRVEGMMPGSLAGFVK